MQVSGYELENLEEMDALKNETIHELQIVGRNPYVSLDFRPFEVYLYTGEDSHKQRGIFQEVSSFLYERRRKVTWLTHSKIGPGILAGLGFIYLCPNW